MCQVVLPLGRFWSVFVGGTSAGFACQHTGNWEFCKVSLSFLAFLSSREILRLAIC